MVSAFFTFGLFTKSAYVKNRLYTRFRTPPPLTENVSLSSDTLRPLCDKQKVGTSVGLE